MPEVIIPATGYPDAESIVDASNDPALQALPPDQQEALWAQSIRAIEAYCGQSFGLPYDGLLEVQSARSDALYLPMRIIELRTVMPLNGDPVDAGAIAITHNGGRLAWKRGVVGVGYYEQALQEISDYSYPDQFPTAWLVIDGRWGWDSCPPDVATAIMLDMEGAANATGNALTVTVNYMRAMGIDRLSQGNLDVALAPVPTLSPVIGALLDPYVFLGAPPGRLV